MSGKTVHLLDIRVSELVELAKILLDDPVLINQPKCAEESYVYVLWDYDQGLLPVYVGQTAGHIETRIKAHERDKDFLQYSFVTIETDCADDLELFLIAALKPKYNKSGLNTKLVRAEYDERADYDI